MERNLDQFTAERLLRGESVADETELVEALGELRSGTDWGRQPAEPTLIAGMASAFRHQAQIELKRGSRMHKAKIGAAGVIGALTLTSGLAAVGALPKSAKKIVSKTFSVVGFEAAEELPGDDTTTTLDDSTTTTLPEETTTTSTTLVDDEPKVHPDNHGADVSAAAHEKRGGQYVAGVARDKDGDGVPDHGPGSGSGTTTTTTPTETTTTLADEGAAVTSSGKVSGKSTRR